ncbi:hypothetical protein BDB01DRAFT_259478 [Pilobolus umbonatus]|nr:hypothetical protein BDB01DRAFT_259478 [Pilobolus umbonatus]
MYWLLHFVVGSYCCFFVVDSYCWIVVLLFFVGSYCWFVVLSRSVVRLSVLCNPYRTLG